jgi:DNA-binding CsgD family transcriptional regulator
VGGMSGEFDVEVKTWLPNGQWRHLHQLAKEHNTTVPSLVREIVRRQLAGEVPPAPEPVVVVRSSRWGLTEGQEQALRHLHSQGKSDVQIGLALGISNQRVGSYRRKLRLPKTSNYGRPSKGATTR